VVTPASNPGVALDPATGNVNVAPGVPAGTYSIAYQICETANPSNCATANVSVVVTAPPITADNDTSAAINGGTGGNAVANVFANDTLNGAPINLAAITATVTTPATSIGGGPVPVLNTATGSVDVPPNTPAGTYLITYQICENNNPTNCSSATTTVVVEQALSAVTGTVYEDRNGNQTLDAGDTRKVSWIVEIIRDGAVIGTTRSDVEGNYRFDGLTTGAGYSVQFRNPDNNVVYKVIKDLTLTGNTTVVDQNLPLDPSGVVYDSVTRTAIRGAVVSLLGSGGVPLPVSCFLSPTQQAQSTDASGFYRFDVIPGASPLCPVGETTYTLSVVPPAGYSAPSSVLPAEPGAFDPTGLPGPVRIGSSLTPPTTAETARWYQTIRLAQGDPDVIFNHIPLDPFLTRAPLLVSKTSTRRSANIGDLIPYTITVRNAEATQRGAVDVVDILPPGLRYVSGSALVNGVAAEPQVNDRELRWMRQTIPANTTVTYNLTAVVGAGVTTGDRVNTGVARNDANGTEISNRGQAVVSIVPSAVFDCSEVIGKVYDDLDGDGYQDEGEPGVAGARLATVNGELITTDEFGRYHITCAAVPDAQIGSNFVLKLDERTIAQGYAPTTDNPQSVRLTRGKISEINFGVQRAATTALDIGTQAYVPGSTELLPDFRRRLAALRPATAARMIIQINYQAQTGEDWALAERRVAALQAAITGLFADHWDAPQPAVEANLTRAPGTPGRE
jgi:large repetitive protein